MAELSAVEKLLQQSQGSSGQSNNDKPPPNLLDPNEIPEPKPRKTKADKPKREVDNKTRPAKQTARTNLTDDLQSMFASFAMPLFAFSAVRPELAYDAHIILENAPTLAKQLNDLAQRNPVVHRVLFAMMNGTDSVALAVTLSQVAVPILANHDVIPKATATMFGAPDPEEFLSNPTGVSKNGTGS